MPFAIKAAIDNCQLPEYIFTAQKTMYGGKLIAAGDTVFIFASENEGGKGVCARGIVKFAEAIALKPGVEAADTTGERHDKIHCASKATARSKPSSRRSPIGMTAKLKPNSISNSTVRRRIKSSGYRIGRVIFWVSSFSISPSGTLSMVDVPSSVRYP